VPGKGPGTLFLLRFVLPQKNVVYEDEFCTDPEVTLAMWRRIFTITLPVLLSETAADE
jgi:hypothetical protein